MKLINIGFGNLVSQERLVAIVSPDSAPIKRMVQETRERGMLIDATYGRKTASIFIMDSDHVILSALPPGAVQPEGARGRGIMRGKTFIISGPSGVGKSTVLSALLEKRKNLYFSVSATTRDPRPGELDGIHYHFMDAESFRKWIAMDQFLEYAEYVGNFYGTPKRFVDEAMDKGQDVILDIEVQGALQVTSKRPDTVKIFIAPPSWKELERRLKDRGTDDPEKVQKRLLRAKVEFQTAHTYDYFVINDTVEDAVRELDAIITAEHCKPKERMSVLAE